MRATEIDSNFLTIFSKNFSIYPADRQSSCANNARTRTQAMLWIRLIFNNSGLSYRRATRCVPWRSLLSALASERGLARINALSTYRIRDAKPKTFCAAFVWTRHSVVAGKYSLFALRESLFSFTAIWQFTHQQNDLGRGRCLLEIIVKKWFLILNYNSKSTLISASGDQFSILNVPTFWFSITEARALRRNKTRSLFLSSDISCQANRMMTRSHINSKQLIKHTESGSLKFISLLVFFFGWSMGEGGRGVELKATKERHWGEQTFDFDYCFSHI